jgi:hypothetical protein
MYSFFPFVISLVWLIKKKKNEYGFYIGYSISVVLTYLLIGISRMNYSHYSMIIVPLFVPALVFCIEKFIRCFDSQKNRFIQIGLVILIMCFFFNQQILDTVRWIYYTNISATDKKDLMQTCAIIESNMTDEDTFSVWGNRCRIYLFVKNQSASKYIYQSVSTYSPKIAKEYFDDIQTKKPRLIVSFSSLRSENNESMIYSSDVNSQTQLLVKLISLISQNYNEIFNDGTYFIYKHN